MRLLLSFLICFQLTNISAQQSASASSVGISNPQFKKLVDRYVSFDVDTISVGVLRNLDTPYILLDAREYEEYETSHIKDALYLGYDKPNYDILDNIDPNSQIIVYCSIGYRSGKIGKKLMKKGFKNVRNLYGSIFEWSNRGYPIYKSDNTATQDIHTYNKKWSRCIDNESLNLIY